MLKRWWHSWKWLCWFRLHDWEQVHEGHGGWETIQCRRCPVSIDRKASWL